MKENNFFKMAILNELRFGFIHPYPISGMGEPWSMKIELTHEILREKGIGGILTLTEDDPYGKLHTAAGFFHHHEPIDDCEPPDREGMDRALLFIDNCLKKKVGVAVHCFEGRGRTGTVLCAWLGKKESLCPEDAIKRTYELRVHTIITPSQRAFLKEYLKA